MHKWQKRLGFSLAAVAIATTGCSATAPFKQLAAKFERPAPTKQVVVHPAAGVGQPKPAEKKSLTENFSGAWKSMSTKVGGAFKSKGKKTSDPVSLASDPGPINPGIYVTTAQILEKSGKLDEAEQQYRKAIATDSTDKEAIIGLARLHDRKGDLPVAEKYYLRAIKAHPNHAEFYNDLGLCLARQRKTHQAAKMLSKAVEADPDKSLFRNNLATVLVDLGKRDEALKHFSIAQNESIAHYNVGYLLSKKNDKAEAIRHLRMARRLNPNFSEAHQMLARLDAAEPSNDAPTYRISDNAPLADHGTHRIPAQLTSGFTWARLPVTDSEGDAGEASEAPTPESGARSATSAKDSDANSPARRYELAKGVSYEFERPSADAGPATEATAAPETRDNAFVPAQPEKMTPPDPAP